MRFDVGEEVVFIGRTDKQPALARLGEVKAYDDVDNSYLVHWAPGYTWESPDDLALARPRVEYITFTEVPDLLPLTRAKKFFVKL